MKFTVPRNAYIIAQEQRDIVSERYKRVTAAINNALWHTASDTSHSFYVGSYGRHTAIDTSDIDILVEVPESFLVKNVLLSSSYNSQSRLYACRKASSVTELSTFRYSWRWPSSCY